MEIEVIAAVRDSRALTKNEKLFLCTVASHKDGMYCTHQKNYTDMGFSKATYYRLRESLTETGVLIAHRRMDDTTVYRVDLNALLSLPETRLSHSETHKSQAETRESHCAETKDNIQDNIQDNSSREPIQPEDFSAREQSTDCEASSGVIDKGTDDLITGKETAPAGTRPGVSEAKARRTLARYLKPGTGTTKDLTQTEQDEVIAKVCNPRWQPMVKFPDDRAVWAMNELIRAKEPIW